MNCLDCDHCGGPAIESEDGFFTDGDGGHCHTCGIVGWVSCDTETPPYWVVTDDPSARCNDLDCIDCFPGL